MTLRGMLPTRARGVSAVGLALSFVVAVFSGCAPRPMLPPTLDLATRRARFEAALAARDTRAAALEADLTVWAEGERTGPLPGFRAALALAAPATFRVRVESLFGTALDLGVQGDSVIAWVPARRAALRADARRDSIGLADPGSVGVRLWAASFRPPPEAWAAPDTIDSLQVVRWVAGADSFALAIAPSGLPRAGRVARDGGGVLRARWEEWTRVAGVSWPARLDLDDEAGTWSAQCRIQRVRFTGVDGGARTRVRVPEQVEPLGWADLRRAIERGGMQP